MSDGFHSAKRYAQLALLGAQALSARGCDSTEAHSNAQRKIVARMASLRGLPQKLGQILSLRDLDSNDHIKDGGFLSLTSGGAPVSRDEFCAWLKQSLTKEQFALISSIDERGIAASIGQVHRAQLTDGRIVAIKVQYPTAQENIETDLSALGLLTTPLLSKPRASPGIELELSSYRNELRQSLLRETDYTAELKAVVRFNRYTTQTQDIRTPEPVLELCNKSVLTTTWLDGEHFIEVQKWEPQFRTQVAQSLIRLFLQSLFEWGEIHADPHLGNLRFIRHDGQVSIGLLDFGATWRLTTSEQQSLRTLLYVTPQTNPEVTLDLLCDLQFKRDLLIPLRAKLSQVVAILNRPFNHHGEFRTDSWHISQEIDLLLADQRWNFRAAGPATLMPLLRAITGLIQQIGALGVTVDWRKIRDNLITAPTELNPVKRPQSQPYARAGAAQELRILVREEGLNKVQLALTAQAVERLSDLIPDDVKERLSARNIDLEQISADAIRGGLAPRELFQLDEPPRIIRVWLE